MLGHPWLYTMYSHHILTYVLCGLLCETLCYSWQHCLFDGSGSGICTNGEIRLVNGTARFEGRVELCNGSVWKTVYGGPSYYWTRNDSYVVCRQVLDQLGEELNGSLYRSGLWFMCVLVLFFCITSGAITRRYQYFGKGGRNQLVYVYNRVCNGNETAYTLCEQENYRIGSTDDHTNDIGVTCIPANTSLVQGLSFNTHTGMLTLSLTHICTHTHTHTHTERMCSTDNLNKPISVSKWLLSESYHNSILHLLQSSWRSSWGL